MAIPEGRLQAVMTSKLFDSGERYSTLDKARTERMTARMEKCTLKRVDCPERFDLIIDLLISEVERRLTCAAP